MTGRHPIGVVARRTGLKVELIRAWERRYGVVEPARGDNGRRLYSDRDVERLALLAELTAGGWAIGQLAERDDDALRRLVAEERAVVPRGVHGPPPRTGAAAAEALLERCIEATRRLDRAWLERLLQRGAASHERGLLLDAVLVPLMRRIGELWAEGELRPAHEHLATVVVRSFVGHLHALAGDLPGAPRLVITTPPRQRHELGALVAAAGASLDGWNVTYLGPDLPAEDIAAAAHELAARAVGLSLTYPADDPDLEPELERLSRSLPPATTLLVGGRAAPAYATVLQRIGARVVDGVADLRRELEALRQPSQSTS